jgi:hypothetical protein
VLAVHVRERVLAFSRAAEPGISPARGKDQRGEGGGMNTGQTDYYVTVVLRDTNTGKILESQTANFAGGEEGWASGVRMLIKHQVLVQ